MSAALRYDARTSRTLQRTAEAAIHDGDDVPLTVLVLLEVIQIRQALEALILVAEEIMRKVRAD